MKMGAWRPAVRHDMIPLKQEDLMATNRRVLLKSRPEGEPTRANFDVVESPIPEPKDGEYLSRTIWMSLDPYMRGRMAETKGYAANVNLGDPMVGGTVGQLAKLHGCRAVGIAGGKDKCDYVVKELGFDACVDYRAAGANLFKELRAAAPQGIDVYFENVGGAVQAAVVPQLNDFARVPLCGLISQYNEMQMNPGPDWRMLLGKRATVTRFIVSDPFAHMEGFWKEGPAAGKAGQSKYREDIVQGIDKAPKAFIGLLKGKNFGKLLVQVSDDPTLK